MEVIQEMETKRPKPRGEDILHQARLGIFSSEAARYTSSIEIDERLLHPVLEINSAHIVMLCENHIISKTIANKILTALQRVPKNLEMKESLEDVHMNVEDYVISKIGSDAGGMLNLAKSRNDQVATAIRMALRGELIRLGRSLVFFQSVVLSLASVHSGIVMPGYTHLQRGQPVTLGHHLLSYFDSADRDFERLVDCYLRTNQCPMGAGALATTRFDIDRERVATLLGFDSVLENSLDAVSSRDFATEAIYLCAQTLVDMSRLAEEIILWTTKEFGFAEVADKFASTSSMMPQKKNAVVPEIFRAKTSQVIGDLSAALGILKALPMSYNLDLQELTRNLWGATDKASSSILVLAQTLESMKFNERVLAGASKDELLFATEIADYLVEKFGIPFREAHGRVGRLVRYCLENPQQQLVPSKMDEEKISEILGVKLSPTELVKILDIDNLLSGRNVIGSPNPRMVADAASQRKKVLVKHQKTLNALERGIATSNSRLSKSISRIRAQEQHLARAKEAANSHAEISKGVKQ